MVPSSYGLWSSGVLLLFTVAVRLRILGFGFVGLGGEGSSFIALPAFGSRMSIVSAEVFKQKGP